jgi:cystathionine beta-synthase
MNPRTHYETTGPEIWRQTGGQITHFVAGVGTGGTISGVARYLKERNPAVRVIGADPDGSIYTSPENIHTYKVEGVGEDFWPGTFDPTLVDEWVQVSDRDSLLMARRVTREEGILIGGSGGMAVWAALRIASSLDDPSARSGQAPSLDASGPGSAQVPAAMVVVLLPDSGRGYLSKIYSDDWMRENGFLTRFTQPVRIAAVVAERSGAVPKVVAVGCEQTVAEAIELLRAHDISQLPVVREAPPAVPGDGGSSRIEVHSVAGSLQERSLLDHLFRNPDVLSAKVSTIMDGPFPLVDGNEEVERVVPMLATGSPAVLVQRDGVLIGVVSRADVLEYVAHHRKDGRG